MKKVTIILGLQSSDKTTKAKQLVNGKEAIWISARDLNDRNQLPRIYEETEIIIIEEATSIEQITSIITIEKIKVRKPYASNAIILKLPELIITSSVLVEGDFKDIMNYKNIEIINCPTINDQSLLSTMGQRFLEWANKFFKSEQRIQFDDFLTKFPEERKTCNFQQFCEKLRAYEAYNKLRSNQ